MEYWKANKDIHDQVMDLIARNHPDLAIISDEIVVVFKEKAGKTGGQVVLGSPQRVSNITNALSGEDYKFMLLLGADQWENNLTARQREALLDHLLTACRATEDPKSGKIKLSIARPDIQAFYENVDRYGMWFPRESEEEEPDAVKEMFGAEDDK